VRSKGMLAKIGIPENRVEELQTIPTSKLFEAGLGGGPIVDGRSISDQTWEPNAPAVSAQAPMIVGTCKDESAWLIGERDPIHLTLDEREMRSRLMRSLGASAADIEELVAIYPKARPAATAGDIFFKISSDRSTRMNAIAQVERKTRQGRAAAYMYYFAYDPPVDGVKYRPFHTEELPLVLRLVRYPNSDKLPRQLAGAWAAFARHGNPGHSGIPSWPAYTLDQRATMVFNAENSHTENDPLRETRLKFLTLPTPPAGGRGRAG